MSRPAVDASVFRTLPDIVPGDGPRLLAARLLESTLLRLGRAGVVIERRLAPALSRMHGRRLHTRLGYVRLADYLTERLGMSLRRCQAILRLERALASLPHLAQALEAGEISVSKLEVAAAVATPQTDVSWLDRAKCLPLPALRVAAREASPDGNPSAAGAAESPGPAGPSFNGSRLIEQDDPGRVISFVAPAPVVAIWHWTLDLVRRVAGQQEPAWRCAEYLAAEFLSGVPDTARESSHGVPYPPLAATGSMSDTAPKADAAMRNSGPVEPEAPTPAPRRCTGPAPSVSDYRGVAAWLEATVVVREALASIGASAGPEAILSESPPTGRRSDAVVDGRQSDAAAESHLDEVLDAWDLDTHLRRLVRLRQSLAWRQGHLLAAFARLHLHHDLGFDTFDGWVEDRLAMSTRRAHYLKALDRRLRDLPLLADAYRRGLVSWCQARLLIRVVRQPTQSRWIRYARRVTVRRLEDVIIDCEVRAAGSPAMPPLATPAPCVAACISVSPLPPPDLHPIEPRVADPAFRGRPFADPPRTDAPLHTSAPPFDLPSIKSAGFLLMSRRRISFWCPLEVASLWDSGLRACRAAAGSNLEDWECFLLFVQAMRESWENQEDPHWRRRYRIFERDGWRCKAPGCTSRSGLNEHHITFRSQQGDNDLSNLVALCVGHHQKGLHESHIRCFGSAPDALWWDLGVRPGREPLARYFGDSLVKRRPFVPAGLHKRAAPPLVPSAEAAGG